jgi:membrane associated rhomboid family serine protease
MFVHSGISHIAFNMLALFFFGQSVERQMGSREFLLFYLLMGTLAGIFSFIVYFFTGSNVILLGASGAIYAVLFAYAAYFPDSRIYIFGILPIKATTLVILYTAIELFSQFGNFRSNVGHLTHLAGFAFAFLYFIIRLGINPIDSFRGNNSGRRFR